MQDVMSASNEHTRLLLVSSAPPDVEYSLSRLANTQRHITPAELEAALREGQWDVVVCDFNTSDPHPADIVAMVKAAAPDAGLIFVADTATVFDAVTMMRLGASGFVDKADTPQLVALVQQELNGNHQSVGRDAISQHERRCRQLQKAKDELEISRQQLTGILDTMHEAVISLALPDRRLIYASAACEQIYGYPVERFLQDPDFFRQVVHPDDMPLALDAYQKSFDEGYAELDHRIIWSDGQVRWLHRRLWIIRDEQGQPLCLNDSASDITAYKRAENEGHFHTEILQHMTDGVLIVRADTQALVYTNLAFERMFGYAPGELIGQHVSILNASTHENSLEVAKRVIQTLYETGRWCGEIPNIRKDGSVFWSNVSSIAFDHAELGLVWISVQQDITTQKEAEAALRASEERYRHIVENQGDLVCRYDTTLHVRYGNAAYCKAFGTTPDAIIGEFILDKIPAELHERIWAYIHSMTPENPVAVSSHPSLAEDGSVRWIEWKDRAILDGQGQIVEYQGVGRDITEQRLTEEALRQSEESFRYLFKNNPHPMWVYDRETLAFLEVNAAAIEHYGYSRDEFLAMRLTDIRPAEDVARLLASGEPEFPALRHAGGWRHLLKDGRVIPVDITLHTLDFAGRPAALVVAQDITERQQAEEAIQAAHQLLEQRVIERTEEMERAKDRIEAIFNHSGDGIVLVDVQHGVQQGNYAFEQLLGVSPDSYIGWKLGAFFQSEDETVINLMVREVANTHQTRQVEARLQRPDSRKTHVEISIAPVNRSNKAVTNLVCIIRDITERKRSQAALQKYAAEVRDLYNLAPTGYHSLDRDGTYIRINKTELAWLGYIEPEIVGKLKFPDILTPATRHVFYDNFDLFKDQGWISDLEVEIVRKDGSTFPVLINSAAVYDENGQFLHTRSTMIDISELKRAQQAIAEERNLLRTLIDTVPDFIYVKDTQHRLLMNNLAHARSLGVASTAEAIGKTDLELFPLELATKYHADEDQIFATGAGVFNTEERSHGQEGQDIWALTTKVPLRNLNGEVIGLVGTTHDISHLKASEEALRRSQADLLSVIDSTNTMFILVDREGMVRLANQRATAASETMLGRPMVVGQPITDSLPPTFRAIFHERLAVVLQGQTVVAEFSTTWADQPMYLEYRYYPVRAADGEIIGMSIAIDDISERKHAERQLHYLASLQEHMYDAVIGSDMAYRVQSWNKAAERMYGWTAEEVIGKDGSEILGSELPTGLTVDDARRGLCEMGFWEGEVIHHHRDGTPIYIFESVVVMRDEHSKAAGIITVAHDITARKQAEQILAKKHAQELEMQRYLKALHELTIRLTQTETIDEFYHLVVQEGLAQFGFDRMGLLLYHPQDGSVSGTYGTDSAGNLVAEYDLHFDVASTTGILRRTMDHHERFRLETDVELYTSLKPIGWGQNAVAALWNGEVLGWLAIDNALHHQPISQAQLDILALYAITTGSLLTRKRAEEALRQSEQRFRLFIESAPLAAIVSDDTGAIVLINEAAETLLGYQRNELMGQPIELLVPKPFRAQHVNHRAIYEAMPGARRRHPLELTALRKDGTAIPVDIQLRVINAEPTPMVMSLMIDITERKATEQALKQALAREKELGDLKSRFVSMASHEFRTPLAAIMATTETLMMYRDKMNADQMDARLDKIRQQVNHMKDIMEEVLELARIQAGRVEFKPTLGDLDGLCQEIIEEFDSQASYRGRMTYTCDHAPVETLFDRRLVRQIISNLISNALKYSAVKPVRIDLRHETTQMVLTVADEGIGIPPEDLKHLFEPFHRASNVGTISGTGLGLSITKQAVDLHGGTIIPESIEGAGTTFIVTLPKLDQGA